MHPLDAGLLIAFIVYCLAAGLRSRRHASRSLEQYFLAGRTLKGWQAGISMAATQFAADTPLLVTGLVATAGIFALWRLWIYALAFLMLGFVFAAAWRRSGVLTDAELTEVRYGTRAALWLRAIKALYFGTVFNCTVLAMVLLAATQIAEPFLLWHDWLPAAVFDPLAGFMERVGVPLTVLEPGSADVWERSAANLLSLGAIVAVTALYSATGGLRGVVATDVVQFAVAMIATAAFAWLVVDRAGGMEEVVSHLKRLFPEDGSAGLSASELLAFTPDRAKDTSALLLLVVGLQWLVQMNADGTGYLAQRSMACATDRDARVAAVVFTFAQVLLRSLLWLPLALGLLVLFPPDLGAPLAEQAGVRERTYVEGIAEVLPAGLRGLMLVGMFAALASTLDTHLNWGASYWTNDLYKRLLWEQWLKRRPSERGLVWVARGANLLILAIAVAILPWLSSIQTAWRASLLLGAGMGVMLVLRWIWWRINAWGELATIVVSTLLAPALLYAFTDEQDALRLLLMATAATGAGVATSLVTGPEDRVRLIAFYRRAHPPGFWGPVADAAGEARADGPRRLARAAFAAVAAAFSVFCLLTGIGAWLVESPPPAGIGSRTLWISALIVVGVGLVPVWVRLGFRAPAIAAAATTARESGPQSIT
ncbi:sodium transporter [Sulfurifustis variabilis]|uniref:Sodium transporter n=1 Tax=Sulfurifustis variabilis TaxID=1675686 RepID=A0A1B4V6E7_9GAMM|nr:sodium:solute symporter family protein [Sulfurifustis variabilis]BAU49005.1 sodium transporter [Sulfurifustis variabilis]